MANFNNIISAFSVTLFIIIFSNNIKLRCLIFMIRFHGDANEGVIIKKIGGAVIFRAVLIVRLWLMKKD